ncbi:MAG TPA: hypothetical protein V6C89_03300 [Drouetiella sp.]|jgi:hypothetical protein
MAKENHDQDFKDLARTLARMIDKLDSLEESVKTINSNQLRIAHDLEVSLSDIEAKLSGYR